MKKGAFDTNISCSVSKHMVYQYWMYKLVFWMTQCWHLPSAQMLVSIKYRCLLSSLLFPVHSSLWLHLHA